MSISACQTTKPLVVVPPVKEKSPPSVYLSTPLVRVARARFAAQLGDLKRAQRELGLAADQAGGDAYLDAAWQAVKEGK